MRSAAKETTFAIGAYSASQIRSCSSTSSRAGRGEDGGGISGVAVLAESHISVHTWPEKGFAAFDVFMCGDAQPMKALEVFKRAFNPGRVVVGEHKRGVL